MPYWANWSEQKDQEKTLGETKSPRQDIKNSNDAKAKHKKEEKTRSQRHGHPRHRMATCSGCTKPDKTEEEWPSLSETLSVTKSHRRPWRPRPGAGGKKNSATSDHILILQTTIKKCRRKKPVYMFFLDVIKANAWLDAILYVMHKEGLNTPEWNIVRKIEQKPQGKNPYKIWRNKSNHHQRQQRTGKAPVSGTICTTNRRKKNKEISKRNLGIYIYQTQKRP